MPNYWIKTRDGDWAVQREGADRAAGLFENKSDAVDYAHDLIKSNGGGELITQNSHGQIQSKDTIDSRDPYPPRDTEH